METTPVKDLPVDAEAEENWAQGSKRKPKKSEPEPTLSRDKRKSEVKSLFEKFKLADILKEIDETDRTQSYA